MAKHSVTCTLPGVSLGKSDLEIKVNKDEEVIGTMKISKGRFEWHAKNKKQASVSLSWDEFSELMKSNEH